jgi:hypothetical protein
MKRSKPPGRKAGGQFAVRIVLDTNVLVSALINPGGSPHELVERWEADEFTLVTSAEQHQELRRVFSYAKLERFIRRDQAEVLLANLLLQAHFADELPVVDVSGDAGDNMILATAIAGQASHVVTGDKDDLLSLKQVQGVSIFTVREAVELLRSQSRGT